MGTSFPFLNGTKKMDKYNRMMHLNEHIRGQFKKKLKEIRNTSNKKKKKPSIKN